MFEFKTISASDLYTGLYNRYVNSVLQTKTTDFVTTAFGITKRPFLFIPSYVWATDFLTTCTRIQAVNFEINFEILGYNRLEEITEDIDNVFSYTRFQFNKSCINFEWLGNFVSELEPNLWVSSTKYQCLIETSK